jgi:nucleoside-diphosphate-sugar epimerase
MIAPTNSIIVGNGVVARALADVVFDRPTLVLASGVSNSLESRPEAFQREAKLIEQSIARYSEFHVVYFSTCSIDGGVVTPYITHKLNMERLVMRASASCQIFRLPQLVGLVHNSTLISYFVNKILRGQVLTVQIRAMRNLLDVRDFARVVSLIMSHRMAECVPINIASATEVSVINIVSEIIRLLNRPAQIEFVEAGCSQKIDIRFLCEMLSPEDQLFAPDYWRKTLQHYVPLMAIGIERCISES